MTPWDQRRARDLAVCACGHSVASHEAFVQHQNGMAVVVARGDCRVTAPEDAGGMTWQAGRWRCRCRSPR